MDAGTKQLADILNGNRVLEVPYYQRSYVWKKEQWARFISDAELAVWENKYKDKRYSTRQLDGRLRSADGIYFYVNTQWSIDGKEGIIKLAKAECFKVIPETKPQ